MEAPTLETEAAILAVKNDSDVDRDGNASLKGRLNAVCETRQAGPPQGAGIV